MRAAHSNVIISVGPLVEFTCDLLSPVVKSSTKAGKAAGLVETKNACPTCYTNDETSLVHTRYVCEDHPDHGPFEAGEVAKALVVDESVAAVGTSAEIDAVRKDTPMAPGVVNFTAHPADDVLNSTMPGELSWVVRPKREADPAFQVLLSMTTNSGRIELGEHPAGSAVLLGEIVLSKKQRLVRVERWGEQLVIREVVRPSQLKEGLDVNDAPPDPRLLETGQKFLATFMVDFDGDNYADTTNDRLREFGVARMGGEQNVIAMATSVGGEGQKEASVDDLLAGLEALVSEAAA